MLLRQHLPTAKIKLFNPEGGSLNIDATATVITNATVAVIAWAPRLPTSLLCAAGGKRWETEGRLNAQGGPKASRPSGAPSGRY